MQVKMDGNCVYDYTTIISHTYNICVNERIDLANFAKA
jgi:hypothetical protein